MLYRKYTHDNADADAGYDQNAEQTEHAAGLYKGKKNPGAVFVASGVCGLQTLFCRIFSIIHMGILLCCGNSSYKNPIYVI